MRGRIVANGVLALVAFCSREMLELKKIAGSFLAVILMALSLFLLWVIGYLWSSEVTPAIRNGSLNVETSTMILNRTWAGNEIYIILCIYLLLAAGLAYGAYKVFRRVLAS